MVQVLKYQCDGLWQRFRHWSINTPTLSRHGFSIQTCPSQQIQAASDGLPEPFTGSMEGDGSASDDLLCLWPTDSSRYLHLRVIGGLLSHNNLENMPSCRGAVNETLHEEGAAAVVPAHDAEASALCSEARAQARDDLIHACPWCEPAQSSVRCWSCIGLLLTRRNQTV